MHMVFIFIIMLSFPAFGCRPYIPGPLPAGKFCTSLSAFLHTASGQAKQATRTILKKNGPVDADYKVSSFFVHYLKIYANGPTFKFCTHDLHKHADGFR